MSKRKKSDIGVILAYILIAFVSVVRYDVGWDYVGYSRVIEQLCSTGFDDITSILIASSGKISEPFLISLCYIFHNEEYPALWVFGVYAILTVLFVFLAVNDHKFKNLDAEKNKWALIAFVLYYFLFFMWDGQRQGLAIAIVLFSYKYVHERKFGKFIVTILMCCFIHLSAFLVLPLYLLSRINYNKRFSIIVVLFCILLYIVGAFNSLSSIAELVPYYSRYAADSKYMENYHGFSSLMLLKYIMWILTIQLIPKKQYFIGTTFVVGVVIYIIASGAQLFERLGDYYYYSIILLLPQIAKHEKKQLGLLYITLTIVSFVCYYDMAVTQKRGVTPYKTIWSDSFKKGIEKDRDFN